VIVDAIIGSRKIFQRMKNYCMYSISVCVRIVLTFGILTLAYDWYFPTIATVMFAIFNDGSMLTIAKDRVKPSQNPEMWNLKEIFGTAIVLGTYLSFTTILLFHLAVYTTTFQSWFSLPPLSYADARGMIYLQVSVSGLATVFVTRAQGFSWMFWKEPPGIRVLCAFCIAQIAATFLGAYGLAGFPNDGFTDFNGSGWWYVLVAWIWFLIWFPLMDPLKFLIRALMRGEIQFNRHRFRLHMQLMHGHPTAEDAGGHEYESVITKHDVAHLGGHLAEKMKRRFKHVRRREDEAHESAEHLTVAEQR